MSDTALALPSRRGFLATLGAALVASPAVVRAASLMPIRTPVVELRAPALLPGVYTPMGGAMTLDDYAVRILKPHIDALAAEEEAAIMAGQRNSLLTIREITREAIAQFQNSNKFIQSLDKQYHDQFARDGAKIGSTLRIRLPQDYHGYE